jgi:hypothetical protein
VLESKGATRSSFSAIATAIEGERQRFETVRELEAKFPNSLRIAEGIPVEKLECRLLALHSEEKAHDEADPEGALATGFDASPSH